MIVNRQSRGKNRFSGTGEERNAMTDMLFSFGRGALLAGLPTVLALLSLSAAAQTPARSAFEILEVGRWSNPPKKVNPLAAHHTYRSAAMNCDVGYKCFWLPVPRFRKQEM